MIKVICVNGAPRAGKDTFINICLEMLGDRGRATSSIDFAKRLATYCGWDGMKDLRNRKFLSDLKDLLTKWNNKPIKEIQQSIRVWEIWNERHNIEDDCFLFVCVREPDELEKMRETFGAECIFVTREEAESAEVSNHADEEVYDYIYDLIIDNNGDIDLLKETAKYFLETRGFDFSEK